MSGRGPRLISLPTRIGTLPVGSTIKLNVNGTPWEFLVVHQGLPSDIYDDSCNGTWLLMKDIYSNMVWNSSGSSVYETSTINTWLNVDFLGLLDSNIQSAIKQVKIPYRSGGGKSGTTLSGANGLLTKIFLLGLYELGWTADSESRVPADGTKLSYFEAGSGTSARRKRVAYQNGEAKQWWTRSPDNRNDASVFYTTATGDSGNADSKTAARGPRPAFILPSNFIVTDDMLAA